MIQRRRDPGISLLPKTLTGWLGLVFIAIFYLALIISFQFTSLVLPWIAVIASALGIVLGLVAALRARDISVLLGVLGAITLTITPFMLAFLLSGSR